MMANVAALYVRGSAIDWNGLDRAHIRHKIPLPTYPFQRERYRVDPPKVSRSAHALRPLIHKVTRSPLHQEIIFETEYSVDTLPFLADHRAFDVAVSPGACQLSMVLSAAELIVDQHAAFAIEDAVLPQALVLAETEGNPGSRIVQAVLAANRANGDAGGYEFRLISFGVDQQGVEVDLATHATGHVAALKNAPGEKEDLVVLRQRCSRSVDVASFYAASSEAQIDLGPGFRWLVGLWQGQSVPQAEALARVVLPESIGAVSGYVLHPGLLDACFQTANTARTIDTNSGPSSGDTLLPFAVRALRMHLPVHSANQHAQWWCHATQTGFHKWDIRLLDDQGTVLVAIDGFEMRPAAPDAIRPGHAWRDWLYEVAWQPRPYYGLRPDYLPAPAALATALQDTLASWQTEQNHTADRVLWRRLEELSVDYVCSAFVRAGFTFRTGDQWRTESIIQQISVVPAYRRLLFRLLTVLSEAGVLQFDSDTAVWTVRKAPAAADPAARLAAIEAQAGNSPELALLARCGEKLSEVLRGLQEPQALIHPHRETSTGVERTAAQSPGAAAVNALLEQTVKQIVAALPGERGLRVIELGAGAGDGTARLLSLLPAERTDYLFTDSDARWVNQAQTRFADTRFVRYQLLDIEQLPADMEWQQADLVIAANVLHTAPDVGHALANVSRLIAPSGQLVLLETTHASHFVELTLGLEERWWRFADERQDQPLLSAAQWETQLLAHGFQAVRRLEHAGCALLIAQVPASRLAVARSFAVEEGEPRWLIFADRQGVGEALAAQLRQHDIVPILVYADQTYRQLDEHTLEIHPDQAEITSVSCPSRLRFKA